MTRWLAAVLTGFLLIGCFGWLGCGKYGPPERIDRRAERKAERRAAELEKKTDSEETEPEKKETPQ